MKSLLKKFIPNWLLLLYHRVMAQVGAAVYGYPSRRMVIIGVTGTKGKSTTANIIWKLLTDAGHTVGLTGTVNVRVGGVNELASSNMTMVGRFQLQRLLRRMVNAGCNVAIVETTSEGVRQWRHSAIAYDVCVFTNLTPEHLEAHGGFAQYTQAKLDLFRFMAALPPKRLNGKDVVRASVVNTDSEHGADFFAIGDHNKVTVGSSGSEDVAFGDIQEDISETRFTVNGRHTRIPLLGAWNVSNAVLAVGVGQAMGVDMDAMALSLPNVEQVPGRMEFIDEGQNFSVIVDMAYEPVSLRLLYEFCRSRVGADRRLITLISSTGGGRDLKRRGPNGRVAAEHCDVVIVTNEDPYDDNPLQIMEEVAAGVVEGGKVEGENFWKIEDRRAAIEKACSLAQEGDVVMLTAKGAEPRIMLANGTYMEWDDRRVAREVLQRLP